MPNNLFVVKIFKEDNTTHGVSFVPGASRYLTEADKKILDILDTAPTGLKGNITPQEALSQLAQVKIIVYIFLPIIVESTHKS